MTRKGKLMEILKTNTPSLLEVIAFLSEQRNRPSGEIWTITPDVAEYLIDPANGINAGNRDEKSAEVAKLSKDMASGIWMLTGDSVKLGWDGSLLDGQHRLRACARAQTPFTTLVLSGLDPAFYTTMDTGKGKSASDIFKKAGVKYHAVTSSAAQHLRRWTSSSPITDRSTDKPHTLLDLYRSKWPNLHEYAGHPDVLKIKRYLKHPHATLTALYALFASVDAAAAKSFFAEWADTEERPLGGKQTPVRTLQRSLSERNANLAVIGGRMDDRDRVLMVVKAWRAHAFGDKLTLADLKPVSARAGTGWPGVHAPASEAA